MRLTLSRVALLALTLSLPLGPAAWAQDQSQPSSLEPASAPSSSAEPAPSSAPPADESAPSSAPSEQQSPDQQAPAIPGAAPPPDKHPRTTEEIYQDLNFFGDVFD